ncbi:hypothetical protein SAMN06296386_103306 [Lachnospiraceae bacterium]|nr:hypothetical protein SAMN06296386_103306 [Lachnospiraceae bacterium]
MGKFDDKYCVRLATEDDIDSIMQFIDKYWSAGHLMSTNRKYFEYEFLIDGKVNFVIAVDRATNTIQGIRGLLFSSKNPEKRDYWGSIWKANTGDGNFPLLGTEIRKRTESLIGCRYNLGVGQNINTTMIVGSRFKKQIVRLDHFYRLNPEVKDFKIAVIKDRFDGSFSSMSCSTKVEKVSDIDDLKSKFDVEAIDSIPYKDNWFIKHRYFDHPWYDYSIYLLSKDGEKASALMVTRQVEANGSRVLRVIDYIGDQSAMAGAGQFFDEMLRKTGCEYVDFYVYGFEAGYLKSAGFKNRYEGDDENVIPNYFEPFVQENKDMAGFCDIGSDVTICKGDGDQDRPNFDRDKERPSL